MHSRNSSTHSPVIRRESLPGMEDPDVPVTLEAVLNRPKDHIDTLLVDLEKLKLDSVLNEQQLEVDWNERFQQLFKMSTDTPYDLRQRNLAMQKLFAEFSSFARPIVERLIIERSLPLEKRTIKPLAGISEKFHLGKCMFQIILDHHRHYGSDEAAQKAASNEIRASNAIIGCGVNNLNVCFSMLFSLRGHCVLVSALAPITHETLVYGFEESGKFKDTLPEVDAALCELSERLNLKPHVVTVGDPQQQVRLLVSGEVEVHASPKDGRKYIIRLSRFLPPILESTPSHPHAHMYFQFRPEFLQLHSQVRLSPDAFSMWGHNDPEHPKTDIHEANALLMNKVIPAVANAFCHYAEHDVFSHEDVDLAAFLHSRGANIRHIGHIRELIQSSSDFVQVDRLRQLLLEEMIIRAMKRRFFATIRNMSQLQGDALIKAAVHLLWRLVAPSQPPPNNDGSAKYSLPNNFWRVTLPRDLFMKFDVKVSNDELDEIRKVSWDERLMRDIKQPASQPPSTPTGAYRKDAESLFTGVTLANRWSIEEKTKFATGDQKDDVKTADEFSFSDMQKELSLSLMDEDDLPILQRPHTHIEESGCSSRTFMERLFAALQLEWICGDLPLTKQNLANWLDSAIEEILNSSATSVAALPPMRLNIRSDAPVYLRLKPKIKFVQLPKYLDINEAEILYDEEIGTREDVLGRNDPRLLPNFRKLISIYEFWSRDQPQKSILDPEQLIKRMLRLAANTNVQMPERRRVLYCAAVFYECSGQKKKALSLLSGAVKSLRHSGQQQQENAQISPAENKDKAELLIMAARLYSAVGEDQDAESTCEEALKHCQRAFGEKSELYTAALYTRAECYKAQQHYDKAEQMHLRALAIREEILGKNSSQAITSLEALAVMYQEQNDIKQAEAIYERIIAAVEASQGPQHPRSAFFKMKLANVRKSQGRTEEAEALFQTSLQILEKAFGQGHAQLAQALHTFAEFYLINKRPKDALPLVQQALQNVESVIGKGNEQVANVTLTMAMVFAEMDNFAEAETNYLKAISIYAKVSISNHPRLAQSLYLLGQLYAKTQKDEQAEGCFLRALHITEKNQDAQKKQVEGTLLEFYKKRGRLADMQTLQSRQL